MLDVYGFKTVRLQGFSGQVFIGCKNGLDQFGVAHPLAEQLNSFREVRRHRVPGTNTERERTPRKLRGHRVRARTTSKQWMSCDREDHRNSVVTESPLRLQDSRYLWESQHHKLGRQSRHRVPFVKASEAHIFGEHP